jgi:hypothetical protein
MLRQRPGQSAIEYVHFMRQSFDDNNETCLMIDGSAAVPPHNMSLLMLRGISNSSQYGHAKQCAIYAFDTDYFLSADEVMANILHLAQNMEEEFSLSVDQAPNPHTLAPPISAFVAAGRNSSRGRYRARGGRGGRDPLPNKCSGGGGLDHIMSLCTASDDALLKWTLAKRKMTVQKYGAPSGHAFHNALLSDMHMTNTDVDAHGAGPSEMECADEYDDTEVGTTFCSVAISSSTPPRRDPSDFWVVDSACSINLTAFRSDFVSFDPFGHFPCGWCWC